MSSRVRTPFPLAIDLLRQDLTQRCQANPRYSARAYARNAGLSPAHLNQVLSGKKRLGYHSAVKIARRMKWPQATQKLFTGLVRLESMTEPSNISELSAELSALLQTQIEFSRITDDRFKLISDWYHFAILDLTRTKGFTSSAAWIARRLGIRKNTAEGAIARLQRLGLLRITDDARFIKADAHLEIQDVPSSAIRKFHSHTLKKALVALQSQPMQERDFTSLVMAIDPEDLENIRQRIRAFQCELMALYEKELAPELYALGVQLFRLTKKSE